MYFIDKKITDEIIYSHWSNVIYKLDMYPNFLFYSHVMDTKLISTLFGSWMSFSKYKVTDTGIYTIFKGTTKETYNFANLSLKQLNTN